MSVFRTSTARHRRRGFTLVELAIVLAVAGLLFVGLWRLLSGGNQQVRDQSASSLQSQLIASVKGYLASANGQTFMTNQNPYATFPLALPAVGAACAAGAFCNFLPVGFNVATPNSYGQVFTIQVAKDAALNGTPPNTYSFMIMTTGGDTIPDTSGGRIAALIGGDGGFVYSTNVCGTATTFACGAYGSWAVDVTTTGALGGYGLAAPGAGHIASRSFVSPSADNTFPWLSRLLLPSDVGSNTPLWNTMTTDLLLGGQNLWLGTTKNATAGGGTAHMQNGSLLMEGGTISGTGSSAITITNTTAATNPQISVGSGCAQTSPGFPATCPYSVSVAGDESVQNLLFANAFYAQTFIYQGSDLRLKTNVHPINDPLEDVMKLKPVAFTLKASGKDSFGVIAQDLEKVYPQLVSDGQGMKAVNYDGLIGPLIGAVQELKQENDDLRSKLHDQEKREDALERELKAKKLP